MSGLIKFKKFENPNQFHMNSYRLVFSVGYGGQRLPTTPHKLKKREKQTDDTKVRLDQQPSHQLVSSSITHFYGVKFSGNLQNSKDKTETGLLANFQILGIMLITREYSRVNTKTASPVVWVC